MDDTEFSADFDGVFAQAFTPRFYEIDGQGVMFNTCADVGFEADQERRQRGAAGTARCESWVRTSSMERPG
ncbi:hypothetical protein ACFYSC_28640 [Streptosporangium sp. NPDC004379]|uniref:hypothetical protein n=1 Tax=Streptosporangium sp. NPDC004379 TaxID=3366189 RepID=UPI0036894C72